MTTCSICGREMLRDGVEYDDGQLVHCTRGHVAMVSVCAEAGVSLHDASPASEWIMRLALAFPARDSRRVDVRLIAEAVRQLESTRG